MVYLKKHKIYCAVILVLIMMVVLSIGYYFITIYNINNSYHRLYNIKDEVCLRKFPYPYKAALSICSDIDNTETVEEFLKIQEFLNTKNMTEMGIGVGLEIGNSFYMYDRTNRNYFSYFSNNSFDKIIIRKFIKSGYIDCLHSYGEGYSYRNDALNAITELKNHGCMVSVWTNHARAESNLGPGLPTDLGDNINSRYYHSDVTIPYGIKFVELGCETHVIGQSTYIDVDTFINSFDSKFFMKSIRNVVKEYVKHILSIYGLYKNKYAMYKSNDLVKITFLDDGQRVYEFMRYDIHPDGIGKGANSRGLAYNISKRVLDRLKEVNGYAIHYTHLGKNSDCLDIIEEHTQEALRYLENQYRSGEIYVTTTRKLLNYYINRKYLRWSYKKNDREIIISIHSIEEPVFGRFVPAVEDLQGITFYVPNGKKSRIFINDQEIKTICKNPADYTKRESITIPLTFLEYPI